MASRLEDIEARYQQVEAQMASPEVAADPSQLRTLGKIYAELSQIVGPYRALRQARRDAEEALDMARVEPDPDVAEFLREEAERARVHAEELEQELERLLVPKDPNDGKTVIVEIRAGAGGQEAALWAGELFEMYRHYAERNRLKTEILSTSPSEIGGFKEAVLEVRGKEAWSRFKHEAGVHRVQRVPVTESQGRIHTSTATVAVLPEAEDVEIEVRSEDIELQVFHSSGPGGQSVNTTDSAVRIIHKPSGIVVTSQEERSQLQNREKAMRHLRALLLQRAQEEAQEKESAARRSQVGAGDRAEKIRTYNFPESRVSDHRIKLTSHRLPEVLAGDLDEFTESLLAAERQAQLAEG